MLGVLAQARSIQARRCDLRAEAEDEADHIDVELEAPDRIDRVSERAVAVQVAMEEGKHRVAGFGQPVRDGLLAGVGHGAKRLALRDCFAPKADSASDRLADPDMHPSSRAHLEEYHGTKSGV